jgi:hypothetical protein
VILVCGRDAVIAPEFATVWRRRLGGIATFIVLLVPCSSRNKANGPAVVQRLRMNVHGVIEINPEGARLRACLRPPRSGKPVIGT